MLDRAEVQNIASGYDRDKIKIGVIASHSALDVCDGAVKEGLSTLAVCQRGRERTYEKYYRCFRAPDGKVLRGVVDETWVLPKYSDVLENNWQEKLRAENVLFVPNRSFTSYCGIDSIENDFRVPMVGSRNLLRTEERSEKKSYYWLLEKAGLPYPEKLDGPEDIDELVIVKLPHARKRLERGFFSAASTNEYEEKSSELLRQGVITEEDLTAARIERYIVGPVFNLDFFYSPLNMTSIGLADADPLELLGIDWRFETSLDGHVRLPAPQQLTLAPQQITPEYTVCGHNAATLRESLLERAFDLGEKFVRAARTHYEPGIIGPFCLQTCVDKDLNFYIYDVAPRVGGGTNVHMSVGHPYGNALWRTEMSTGRRVCCEVRRAVKFDQLERIIT